MSGISNFKYACKLYLKFQNTSLINRRILTEIHENVWGKKTSEDYSRMKI